MYKLVVTFLAVVFCLCLSSSAVLAGDGDDPVMPPPICEEGGWCDPSEVWIPVSLDPYVTPGTEEPTEQYVPAVTNEPVETQDTQEEPSN